MMLEPIDPTSPNLDGDFKAILEMQSKKEPEPLTMPQMLPITEEIQGNENNVKPSNHVEMHSIKPSASLAEVAVLRELLFCAVEADDPKSCKEACAKVKEKGVSMAEDGLRDESTSANALHYAVIHRKLKAARYFIEECDADFLMGEYMIDVKGVHSSKTVLHLLTELGDVDLCKLFLQKLPPGQGRSKYLGMTVLTEMEGQRPRHLSSIHIAALKGNTQIIELLVDLGVSVNTINNKNDTPILWAARNNHISTVRRLIQLKADLHCENDKGSTPLYWAIRYGFPELVEILIKEGKANVHQKRKLGLVSPIVLASALGYVEILKTLIQHGAEVNTKIPGGQTALQLAASNDNTAVIDVLLKHGAIIDDADDSGNTPLMYAVSGCHIASVEILIRNNASMDCKDKMGRTIWNFAIDYPDDMLLKILVQFYRNKLGQSESKTFKMPPGKTPLHVAAVKGDTSKMKCLFDIGVDPMTVDQNGNTYFHVAARTNCTQVIETFLGSFDINCANGDGDTPIHLAVKHGHIETVKLLLQKAKLDIRNNSFCTVLHVAALSSDATPELVKMLIEVMVKTTSWSLVDAKDRKGNTALNIVAKKGHSSLVEALSNLNPMIANDLGDTPLHTAAKLGHGNTLEEIINVFCQPGKGLHIDKQNKEGDTALHICARMGDSERVRLLIRNGADLAIQNEEGNTVLHELCEFFMLQPQNKDTLTAVYHTIVQEVPRWWCIRNDLHLPDEDSEMFVSYQKKALLFLTSDVHNAQGLDVVKYAGSLGSIDILSAIFSTPDIYQIYGLKGWSYDVSNLAPDLEVVKVDKKKPSFNSIDVLPFSNSGAKKYTASNETFLDIIVSLKDEVTATNILDMTPVKELVANYWKVYQWIYGLLMLIHVVYMGCFTGYSIPTLKSFFLNESNNIVNSAPNAWPMVLFLTWPVLIFLFEIYTLIARLVRSCRSKSKISISKICTSSIPSLLAKIFSGFLSHVIAYLFVFSVGAWFVLYILAVREQVYLVSVILILGWLFTIAFTKGFEQVHTFSIMLKYIFIKDITRFLIIYSFVLLGFSFAFQALLQVAPNLALGGWKTLFITFNLMLGLHDVLEDDFETEYGNANGNVLYFQIVYLGYVSLSTIILLNLLIAMMTDTYTAIKAKEGMTWRVGSVRLALDIEKSLPFIKKFFKSIGLVDENIKRDVDSHRWMMVIPWGKVDSKSPIQVNAVMKSIERLENRVLQMYVDLSKQIDDINTRMDRSVKSRFNTVKTLTSTIQSFKNIPSDRPGSGRSRRKSIAQLT